MVTPEQSWTGVKSFLLTPAFLGALFLTNASNQAVFGQEENQTAAPPSEEVKPKPFTAVWEGEVKYPAVCVGKARWLISAIPIDYRKGDQYPHAPKIALETSEVDTKILHLNAEHRICLLEAASELPGARPFPIASQGKIVPGIQLTSLTSGEFCHSRVAGKDFEYLGEDLPCPLIRIHLESNEGHFCLPGTPLINQKGEIEGLLSERKLQKEREAHAIPAPVIGKMIWEMEHHQKSGPVWLGITFHTRTTTPEIVKVSEDSPAAKAGIEDGDVLLSINGNSVEGLPDLVELIHSLPAGKEASFRMLRDVKEMTVELTPVFAQEKTEDPKN